MPHKRGWPGLQPRPSTPHPPRRMRGSSPPPVPSPPLTAWSEVCVPPRTDHAATNKLLVSAAVLLQPLRARSAHVVQLGPIRMQHVVRARPDLHGRGADMLPHALVQDDERRRGADRCNQSIHRHVVPPMFGQFRRAEGYSGCRRNAVTLAPQLGKTGSCDIWATPSPVL